MDERQWDLYFRYRAIVFNVFGHNTAQQCHSVFGYKYATFILILILDVNMNVKCNNEMSLEIKSK